MEKNINYLYKTLNGRIHENKEGMDKFVSAYKQKITSNLTGAGILGGACIMAGLTLPSDPNVRNILGTFLIAMGCAGGAFGIAGLINHFNLQNSYKIEPARETMRLKNKLDKHKAMNYDLMFRDIKEKKHMDIECIDDLLENYTLNELLIIRDNLRMAKKISNHNLVYGVGNKDNEPINPEMEKLQMGVKRFQKTIKKTR